MIQSSFAIIFHEIAKCEVVEELAATQVYGIGFLDPIPTEK